MRKFYPRHLTKLLILSGAILSSQSFAAGFQLWEQDGASIGNYHAGYAAEANDASTAFYNPAGLTRIKNQQVVAAASAIQTNFAYEGTINVSTLPSLGTPYFRAPGGIFAIVPALQYAAPISDKLAFGFNIVSPFGLKTNYGHTTPLKYAATLSKIAVIDISPSLGYQLTDKASVGLGFDVQKVDAELRSISGSDVPGPSSPNNTLSKNKADGTHYGYHLGGLYQFDENTRVGISYHSRVQHHLSGHSTFSGPLALGTANTNQATTNITLPAYTALSAYHKINPKVAVMGSFIYTEWSVVKELILKNVASTGGGTTTLTVPEHYHNSKNISIGADYFATDKLTLRTGIGFDESPLSYLNRNVQLPDSDRYVAAIGAQYQLTNTVKLSAGWMHFFLKQARINPPSPTGGATVITSGHVNGTADVWSGQITWDIT